MMDIGSWIIFATTLLVFAIFLIFDAFKRNEPYGNLAYIVAVVPINYLWYKITTPTNVIYYKDFGVTGVWAVLLFLWLITIVRDMILVRIKKKDFDDVVLYLIIGLIIQLILSAVLPAKGVIPNMQAWYGPGTTPIPRPDNTNFGTYLLWFFYLPNPPSTTLVTIDLFRVMATLLVIGVIVPMILDLRGEPVNMWVLVIITLIFALPIALICYLWVPQAYLALLLLVCVLFFIVLLLLTRGTKEEAKQKKKGTGLKVKPKP